MSALFKVVEVPDLLLELGCEELPAGYIEPALAQIESGLGQALRDARLEACTIRVMGTPRRLAAHVTGLLGCQPDTTEEVSGPPVSAAYDSNGKPTKAARGFARAQGVKVADLVLKETPRGEYCFAVRHLPGSAAEEVLPRVIADVMTSINFPKSMCWGPENQFARPVRWIVALLDYCVLGLELFGLRAGCVTQGHPFLSPGDIHLESASLDDYISGLRERKVLVDFEERSAAIWLGIRGLIEPDAAGFREDNLLVEVANLVENPGVVGGNFDEKFLALPAEVIETAMKEHQRYFPVRNADGKLEPRFIVVSDRGGIPPDIIRDGNEAVLGARFADAEFFYKQDRKTPLQQRVDDLKEISFLTGLGTYADKAGRLAELVSRLSDSFELSREETDWARQAAHFCKADLLTEMVGEFPALQGVMGRIYAIEEGLPEQVGRAIEEHYLPRRSGDPLPPSRVGRVLSVADKLDNISACFALGLSPSGSQDPYALRRQSQATLRILDEARCHLDLGLALEEALGFLPPTDGSRGEALAAALTFLNERLLQLCLDAGHPHDLIRGVMRAGTRDVADFFDRLRALEGLVDTPVWRELVTVVERTYNIGKKETLTGEVDQALFELEEERRLWNCYDQHCGEITSLADDKRYRDVAIRFAEVFAEPVHTYFDTVFVNVEDRKMRNNRLLTLKAINDLFVPRVADLSEIVTGVER